MIIGHKKNIEYLQHIAEIKKPVNGYLFYGPDHIGKRKVAFEFAKALNCGNNKIMQNDCFCESCQETDKKINPDLFFISPLAEKKEIGIFQIKELQKSLNFKPYKNRFKIVIIDQSDSMTSEAQNALLKTLEEPNGETVFILLASNKANLFKTIKSRLQLIQFNFVSKKDLLNYFNDLEAINFSFGAPGIAFLMSQNPKILKKYLETFNNLINLLDKGLIGKYQYIELLIKSQENIADSDEREVLNYNKEKNGLESFNKRGSEEFIDFVLIIFRDLLYAKLENFDFLINNSFKEKYLNIVKSWEVGKILNAISEILELQYFLKNTNINERLGLEALMLKL